jgi:hypothetical protein
LEFGRFSAGDEEDFVQARRSFGGRAPSLRGRQHPMHLSKLTMNALSLCLSIAEEPYQKET